MSLEPIEAIRALILEAIEPLPPRPAPLAEAAGRTAARDYRATSALPPFSNSAMDGYALRSRDTAGAATGAPAVLSVTAEIPAGGAAGPALGRGEAAAIMTGAPLPPGADAVVPVEEVETGTWSRSGRVGILSPVPEGAWVRKAGSALLPGTLIIPKGRLLRPQEIAILAALGIAEIEVYPRPRAALISTGDELTETGRAPEEGKIRDCNRALLRALVEGAGGVAVDCGIAGDRPHALEERLERAAGTDLILTSGGISAGARDEVVPHLRRWGADIRR
ncbi:MAG TPA: molybdopterin molybdotransferase MoeA, partial [bacterium]|nr:molybdopterin molybdotransferase MoeA [bacterium]